MASLSIVLNALLVTGDTLKKESLRTGVVYSFDTDTLKYTLLISMCLFASFILGNNNKHNMKFSESGLSSPSSVFSHLLSDSIKVIIIVTFNTLVEMSC